MLKGFEQFQNYGQEKFRLLCTFLDHNYYENVWFDNQVVYPKPTKTFGKLPNPVPKPHKGINPPLENLTV